MISNFLLVLGVAILSAALRSFRQPWLFRLGTLGIAATSFLAGWLLGGSPWLGAIFAVSWLFLPWLEILTRVRQLRLPAERILAPRTPPSRNAFPGFAELTDEVEAEGFEHLEDTGWEYDDNRQFFRVFFHEQKRIQTCICLVEQGGMAFFYISLTSRAADQRIFMTWNYPFSYGLQLPPRLHIRRFSGASPFSNLLAAHEEFLRRSGVAPAELIDQSGEEVLQAMQTDLRSQISHNLDIGLLKRDGERFIRYTIRGMFFLWFQFLRDLVRFS